MNALGSGYQHWRGVSTGIWQRRATIARYGLRLCWSSRLLKMLFFFAAAFALSLVSFHILVGQLLTSDSSLMTFLAENVGKKAHAVFNGIAGWILLYPEVAVDGLYRTSFYVAAHAYIPLSFFAIALFVPKLIAHDLSSQAILIYNSKALTHRDYLLGKFGIVAGLLALLCLAPTLAIWFVGNLASPDWSFFLHGFPALLRALALGCTSVVALSLMALAISSLAKRTGTATAFWIFAWIGLDILAQGTARVFSWGIYLSPGNCLHALTNAVFDLGTTLEKAKTMLPFFDVMVQSMPRGPQKALALAPNNLWLPLLFLAGYCGLSLLVVSRRTQPE